jgi:hypothetical protein
LGYDGGLGPDLAKALATNGNGLENAAAGFIGTEAEMLKYLLIVIAALAGTRTGYAGARAYPTGDRKDCALSQSDRGQVPKSIAGSRKLAQQTGSRREGKEAKERAAKKACLNRDTEKGVALLTDLYVDTNDPTYIFNQGRCYEQGNMCEDAIVRFREYLRKRPNGNDRSEVARHIADCEALLAKRSEAANTHVPTPSPPPTVAPPTVPPPTPASSPAEQPSPPVTQPVPVVSETSLEPGPAQPRAGYRTAGIVTLSAGAAFVITGAVFNWKHNSMTRDAQNDYNVDTVDSARTYKTLSLVGYGVGAACLVGGAALTWFGYSAGHTVLAPDVADGRAGLLLTGAF